MTKCNNKYKYNYNKMNNNNNKHSKINNYCGNKMASLDKCAEVTTTSSSLTTTKSLRVTRQLKLLVLLATFTLITQITTVTVSATNIQQSQIQSQFEQHHHQQQQQQQQLEEQYNLRNNIKSTSTEMKPIELLPSSGGNINSHSHGHGTSNDLLVQHGDGVVADDDVYIASLVNSQSNLNTNHNGGGGYSRNSGGGGGLLNLDDYNGQSNTLLDEQNVIGSDVDIEETTFPPPVFDFGMPRNITARTGQTAAINCRVENLGDKSVSWIRKRDLHILTAGILTYTSDERFKVVRTADSKDWTLHVKYAQPRDTGIYECQVNTEPKISMAFRLNVIVTPPDAKAIIAGPTDLYVKVGSVITLTCHVQQPTSTAHDIGPIYWYRGQYVLTPFVAHPNDAAIDLQRISMESTLAEKLQSRLRIANAQLVDSGNYTCMPTTAEAASVMVNVINDESPAAMQKSGASASTLCRGHNSLTFISCNLMTTITATTTIASMISVNTVVRWFQYFLHLSQQKQQQKQKYLLLNILIQLVVKILSFVHIKYPIKLFHHLQLLSSSERITGSTLKRLS